MQPAKASMLLLRGTKASGIEHKLKGIYCHSQAKAAALLMLSRICRKALAVIMSQGEEMGSRQEGVDKKLCDACRDFPTRHRPCAHADCPLPASNCALRCKSRNGLALAASASMSGLRTSGVKTPRLPRGVVSRSSM